MSDSGKDNTELSEVVADLVEILRDLRSVIDPAGAVRPLNIAEAARAMRCRRSEVQSLIDRGAIPCIRRNGRRYVLPSDVGQWLRNEAETAVPKIKRRTANSREIDDEIDPALREFFD